MMMSLFLEMDQLYTAVSLVVSVCRDLLFTVVLLIVSICMLGWISYRLL